MKKTAKSDNSVILNPSYNQGFVAGTAYGMKTARMQAAIEFVQNLAKLEDIPGIGPKTYEKIVEALSVSEHEGENSK